MRRLNKPAYRHESRLWNLCAVFGMHTRRRIWHDPPATMASGEPEKIQGMIRLYSCQSERLQNRNRYKEEEFKFIKFFFHLLLLCVQSYQIVYASMAYVKRVIRMPNATLGIDHLAGSYAINGALVILANLILHSQPYEWDEDCNKETREARALLSDVDTSNAWIYESFMALALQLIVWTGLQLWHFGRTVSPPQISKRRRDVSANGSPCRLQGQHTRGRGNSKAPGTSSRRACSRKRGSCSLSSSSSGQPS